MQLAPTRAKIRAMDAALAKQQASWTQQERDDHKAFVDEMCDLIDKDGDAWKDDLIKQGFNIKTITL